MDENNLKEQKLQELKEQLMKQRSEEEAAQRAEMQIDLFLRKMLTNEAKSRLTNVKLANPETYAKAVQALMYFQQSSNTNVKLGDSELKELLAKLKNKRETTIKRK